MRQTASPLFLFALFFALLCFQADALHFFGDNSPRNTTHATSSGVINLKKDEFSNGTFYVEADLSSSYSPSSSLAITDSVQMMVSIANSETLVALSCLSFNNYDCSRYNCSNYGPAATIEFPTFTAQEINYGRGFIYLDYKYWGLNYAYLYYAQSCNTLASPGTGTNRYGVLGLGTGGGSRSNFISSAIFSILIDSDQNAGKLLLMKDSRYTQSGPLHTFSANDTWQISVTNGSIETPSAAVAFTGNVMFDINSDVIGLPYDVYTLLFNYFKQISNVSCLAGTYRPSCDTTLKLEELPDLTLSINGDHIKIPSKIYATLTGFSETHQFFWFNFKATDGSMTGKSYVSPSFTNYVILGANFMSYYYTVFDARTSPNTIYIYSSSVSPSPQEPSSWWIGVVVVAAIVLVGVCFFAYKKKAQIASNETTVTAPLNNTTDNQTPLAYNHPTYSYDTTNSHYPAQPQGVYQPYPPTQEGLYTQGYAAPPPAGVFQERAKQ
jgi:hypothetical protein